MLGKFIPALLLCCSVFQSAYAAEDKPAPPVEARLLDGQPFSPKDYAGKVLLVNFWATWCAPCRLEMPALQAYYARHHQEGFELLAISVDDPSKEAQARAIMRDFTFSGAFIRDASVKGFGRIWRLPLTFVIDRKGILRKDDWYADPGLDVPLLEATVTPLLRAEP